MGWALAGRLAGQGEPVAFVDIDQLGMCYPAIEEDPHRWKLKERALVRIADQYAAAGIARLIVSGVAFPEAPPPEHPRIGVRSLWLDADAEVRRDRLTPRGWEAAQAADVVRIGTDEAARLEGSWERLPTDDLTLDQTVEAILSRWPPTAGRLTGTPAPTLTGDAAPGVADHGRRVDHVLFITGPRCAGASTLGWLIAAAGWQQGHRTGFIDIAQLSFTWNVEVPTGLANGAALLDTFAGEGCRSHVVVAPLDVEPASIRAAFAGMRVSVVRLDATAADLRDRALARTRGEGPLLPGDDLLGASPAAVDALVAAAVAQRDTEIRPGETLIDTSGLGVDESRLRVEAAAGW